MVGTQETLALARDCETLLLSRDGHDLANTTDYAHALARFFDRLPARQMA